MMKKALSLLLAVMMLLSLVACGGNNKSNSSSSSSSSSSTTTPPPATTPPTQGMASESAPSTSTPAEPSTPAENVTYKERAVVAHTVAINKQDPHNDGTATGYMAYRAVHGHLLDYIPETGEYRPDLAESWDINGTVYTFHLRKGVTFHNGEPFTAKDVVFSVNAMKEGSATKAYVTDVVDVRAIDDYTVEIELSAPNAEFLVKIGLGNACILNEKAVTELGAPEGTKIGTGAYIWTEQAPSDYNLFTRNENYWGELPPSKEILFKYYAEPAACSIALQTGEVDVQLELAAADAHFIAEDPNTTLVQVPTFKLVYLALNTYGTYPEYANQKVRQALSYATNPEDIIIAIREGYAFAPNGMIPIGVWGYDENVKACNYDPDKAIALLAEEGYGPSNPLEVQICATSTFAPIFDILQAQWAAVGVNLTLQTSDGTTYSDLRKQDPPAHWAGIHQYNFTGTDSPLRTIWHSTGSSNHSKTFSPELDAMLDAAVQELDPAKRLEKYAELSQWLADWCGWIPLYQDILLIGERANVTGMYYGPATDHDFTYIGVVEG